MGGAGSSGPTLQQQQLQTQQALTTANLNLEENAQRKSILNALQGTRVFRGSALSRAVAGNTNTAPEPQAAPSNAQINSYSQIIAPPTASLLDQQARGSSPAGGAGASGNASAALAARVAAGTAAAAALRGF